MAQTSTATLKPSVDIRSAATAKQQNKSRPSTRTAAKETPKADSNRKRSSHSIAVLVGDEPITGYEIEQRQNLMAQGGDIGKKAQANFQSMVKSESTQKRMKAIQNQVIEANEKKSREEIIAIIKAKLKVFAQGLQKQALESARAGARSGLRKKALDELIDERLMVQEAKRVGVLVSEADIDKALTEKAQRGNLTLKQYSERFKQLGIDIETLRSTYRAQMSWRDVIGRRFGHQVQVTEREVDRVVSSLPKEEEDGYELQLQRITLAVPEKVEQQLMAKRFQEAETIWRRFNGCSSLGALAASTAGARLDNVGPTRPSAIPEPTRGLLLSASDGSMIPPSLGQNGLELWAVCGRSVIKADDKNRDAVEVQLRREQFSLLADRHLKDLRKDTPIEYR